METINMFDLEDQYENYATECECGMRTVLARLENLRAEMEISEERSYFAEISSRIKEFDSACEKAERKGQEIGMKTFHQMHDIAGIRIVTPFLDDVYEVRKALVRQPSMTVVEERDYIKNPKPNGYRSLHLIVDMDIYFMATSKRIRVEIQIRSKAQDYWASTEHLLRYKNPNPSPVVEEKLKTLADELSKADETAIELRDFNIKEAEEAEEGELFSSEVN